MRGPDRKVKRKEVLDLFEPGRVETSSTLAERSEMDVHPDTIYNRLKELYELDEINTKKVGGRARVWWVHDPTRDVDPTGINNEDWRSSKDPKILRELARVSSENTPLTSMEISNRVGETKDSCYNRLRALDEKYDVIESVKAGATSKVWWIEEMPTPEKTTA